MVVNDILRMAKAGALANLALKSDDETLRLFLYLAVSSMYQRFNMLIKTESVTLTDTNTVYDMRASDLGLVLSLYESNGRELIPSSVTDGVEYDYTQISYRTFLFKPEFKGRTITFVYSASPKMYTKNDEVVDLPTIMIPAVLDYIGYMGHSTVNVDTNSINVAKGYYEKFDKACQELEALGYKVNIASQVLAIQAKGWR